MCEFVWVFLGGRGWASSHILQDLSFPDQGSNPCPLHWQADSQPLRHQGSLQRQFFNCYFYYPYFFSSESVYVVETTIKLCFPKPYCLHHSFLKFGLQYVNMKQGPVFLKYILIFLIFFERFLVHIFITF